MSPLHLLVMGASSSYKSGNSQRAHMMLAAHIRVRISAMQ